MIFHILPSFGTSWLVLSCNRHKNAEISCFPRLAASSEVTGLSESFLVPLLRACGRHPILNTQLHCFKLQRRLPIKKTKPSTAMPCKWYDYCTFQASRANKLLVLFFLRWCKLPRLLSRYMNSRLAYDNLEMNGIERITSARQSKLRRWFALNRCSTASQCNVQLAKRW